MAAGAYAVARRYILYREARARRREEEPLRLRRPRWPGNAGQPGRAPLLDRRGLRRASRIASRPRRSRRMSSPAVHRRLALTELDRAIVLAARSRIEQRPGLLSFAARALLRGIYGEALGRRVGVAEATPFYAEAFVDYDHEGVGTNCSRRNARASIWRGSARRSPGARPPVPLSRPADALRSLPDPQRRSPDRAAAGVLDAGRDGAGAAARPTATSGRSSSTPALDVPLLPLDPDALQRRHAHPQLSSCYLTTVQDDLDNIFKSDPRQRAALEVERRASATTGRRCAPSAAGSRAPTARARA